MAASRPERSVRILVADAQPLLRDGIARILEAEPELSVVARVGDGSELLRARAESPDIALVDFALPGAAGLRQSRPGRRRLVALRPRST